MPSAPIPVHWEIADFRAVSTVLAPSSTIQTLATFEIADGVPGALPA